MRTCQPEGTQTRLSWPLRLSRRLHKSVISISARNSLQYYNVCTNMIMLGRRLDNPDDF